MNVSKQKYHKHTGELVMLLIRLVLKLQFLNILAHVKTHALGA